MRSKNERQPVVVASTCISLRCNLIIYTYITHIYSIHIYLYLCTAYISSHSKGPEQDQLRNPFVPYVRNSAERSIHNFDSQPYIYLQDYTDSFGVSGLDSPVFVLISNTQRGRLHLLLEHLPGCCVFLYPGRVTDLEVGKIPPFQNCFYLWNTDENGSFALPSWFFRDIQNVRIYNSCMFMTCIRHIIIAYVV